MTGPLPKRFGRSIARYKALFPEAVAIAQAKHDEECLIVRGKLAGVSFLAMGRALGLSGTRIYQIHEAAVRKHRLGLQSPIERYLTSEADLYRLAGVVPTFKGQRREAAK